jgi:transcriptional regulator with XRE-family HTH domain
MNKGWTLDYVGERVGLTKVTVHEIENGKCKPSYDSLIKFCKLYGVRTDDIEYLLSSAGSQELA